MAAETSTAGGDQVETLRTGPHQVASGLKRRCIARARVCSSLPGIRTVRALISVSPTAARGHRQLARGASGAGISPTVIQHGLMGLMGLMWPLSSLPGTGRDSPSEAVLVDFLFLSAASITSLFSSRPRFENRDGKFC